MVSYLKNVFECHKNTPSEVISEELGKQLCFRKFLPSVPWFILQQTVRISICVYISPLNPFTEIIFLAASVV